MAAQSLYKILTATVSNTTLSSQSDPKTKTKPHFLQNPWLGLGSATTTITRSYTILSLHPLNLSPLSHKNHRTTTTTTFASTVVSSLPTAKPDRGVSAEKVPRWSWRAIKSFAMAELEARKLKYPTTGTEALLLGILVEGTSLASKFLRANGIGLLKVREEAIKLLGKADLYFFSPEHPPLTEEAQRALDWAIDHKLKSGDSGEVTTSDLLLGIWSEVESPGHKIMAMFGFNDEKAKELETLSSGPDFVDG